MVVKCSLQLCSDHGKTLYFTTRDVSYDVNKLYENLTLTENEKILFIHAVTDCDTVS